jgi:hypothetical protein
MPISPIFRTFHAPCSRLRERENTRGDTDDTWRNTLFLLRDRFFSVHYFARVRLNRMPFGIDQHNTGNGCGAPP